MPGGRPRSYDPEAALNAAMLTFWTQGYEGTAMSDLTTAMGMSAPSVYAAFGDKETLFRKAVERYMAGPGDYLRVALDQRTAEALARTFLHSAVEAVTGDDTPHGCLIVQSALAVNPRAASVQEYLTGLREDGVQILADRLRSFPGADGLPPGSDPSSLARLLVTVVQGLAVQAASGTERDALRTVADQMMLCWPRKAE
ncbi:TetR/AcrR family transcriptional regulator [Streptomyces yaizuensis]|uniref:TetR/AcrR family transcriptional regulator n=1 Tax=Streptomyces yaizuensis TaxID=2989713 RepID=A0ABQ5NXN8_9ACTN|nr:TetR/AcrR family transcriptional regulator [Streptomyces sp. YSPA8]GLF95140.1 TetR/AcrR family transcriptional regulator [Streptomyces sp. YSPA8]